MPRFSTEKVSARMACSEGCSPPPPAPCRIREENQHRQARSDAAEERTDREQRDAAHVEALAADHGRQPAGDRQHDGARHEIAGQHPGRFLICRAERPGDMRQRHVGDGGIQHFHERGQRHRQGDEIGIVRGPPAFVRLSAGSPPCLIPPLAPWAPPTSRRADDRGPC